ncbi:hypothetical protein Pmar_PMAR025703, partial [Perkinsus marinus ATCC 50983]
RKSLLERHFNDIRSDDDFEDNESDNGSNEDDNGSNEGNNDNDGDDEIVDESGVSGGAIDPNRAFSHRVCFREVLHDGH